MTRRAVLVGLTFTLSLLATSSSAVRQGPAVELPARLSDPAFWSMIETFSEPNGYFDSDNLVSNEDEYQTVIPEVAAAVHPGAYLGVGPDQNFAYIIGIRPKIAFITDIRRGNVHVHLMYKALIEMSADRGEFLSRLFSRASPGPLPATATAEELLEAFTRVTPDRRLYESNLRAVFECLTGTHHFQLTNDDRAGIAAVYAQFFAAGPSLRFVSSRGGSWYPSYENLQTATDGRGVNRGYLGSEALFGRLREYERNNLIVPIVGDFAGRKALRAVGAYLEAHGTIVSVFYTSNVERYLFQNGVWSQFVANLAALPVDDASRFIRSCFDTCSSAGGSRAVTLVGPMASLVRDAQAGRISTYRDVLTRGHSN